MGTTNFTAINAKSLSVNGSPISGSGVATGPVTRFDDLNALAVAINGTVVQGALPAGAIYTNFTDVDVSTLAGGGVTSSRYMFAGLNLRPYTKQYQVASGQEFVLSRRPVTPPVYGAIQPRLGFGAYFMPEGGGNPVESALGSSRTIAGVFARYLGTYYRVTFEGMRGISGLTVTSDGFGITIADGQVALADALPITVAGNEVLFCETMDQAAIGDFRGGDTGTIASYLGEAVEYSASDLSGKLGNGSALANNSGTGTGQYVPGPICMFAKGWDGRPVAMVRGTSIYRGTGVLTESRDIRGAVTGVEFGLSAAQIPFWNCSVSGLTMGSTGNAFTRSGALFAMLGNVGGAAPFTVLINPGPVNDKTSTLTSWQNAVKAAWAIDRATFPGVRMVQEYCPPYTATTDALYGWTDQGHQIVNSSPAGAFASGGIRDQLNTWMDTQIGVGDGPDAVLNSRAAYSEDAPRILTRSTSAGTAYPKMADAVMAVASSAGQTTITITTDQIPQIGANILIGVGTANAIQKYVRSVQYRPDIGAKAYEIVIAGTTPTGSGSAGSAHALADPVLEQFTVDGLHYSRVQQAYMGETIFLTGAGSGAYGTAPAVIANYQTETKAYFDRLPLAPSYSVLRALDDFVMALKVVGVWQVTDFIYDLTAIEGSALLNMKGTAYAATKVGSVTFSNGVTGDGVSSYLDTGFNPSTAGGSFAQNSAHMGVFILSNIVEAVSDIGSVGLALEGRRSSSGIYGRINSAAAAALANGPSTSYGHAIVSRDGSTSQSGYKNGFLGVTDSTASTAVVSGNMWVLRGSTGYSTKKLGLAHAGGSLTAIQVAAFYRASYQLMAAKGAFGV